MDQMVILKQGSIPFSWRETWGKLICRVPDKDVYSVPPTSAGFFKFQSREICRMGRGIRVKKEFEFREGSEKVAVGLSNMLIVTVVDDDRAAFCKEGPDIQQTH